jgi:hypothetical protein
MIATFNEKHHAAEFAAARAAGGKVGAFVRAEGWVKADQTIARAATGWVNRQPLNNIKLEVELRWAYIIAAETAATAEVLP